MKIPNIHGYESSMHALNWHFPVSVSLTIWNVHKYCTMHMRGWEVIDVEFVDGSGCTVLHICRIVLVYYFSLKKHEDTNLCIYNTIVQYSYNYVVLNDFDIDAQF